MKLTSISASSIQTFEGCTARYYAENVERTPSPNSGSDPARLGSAVHNALERMVSDALIDKVRDLNLPDLLSFYQQEFMKEFKRIGQVGDNWYDDGVEMLTRWIERADFDDVRVEMVEQKMKVPIKTSIGEVPYTFIFDRLDTFERDGKKIVRVVDYKTWRQYLTPEALRQKPQARLYAMAIAIAFKHLDPDEIWVCFDQLRYDSVEIPFDRDDNVKTWKYVREVAERIIQTPDGGKRTLNPECQFCVLKSTCPQVTKNIEAGGVMSFKGDRNAMAQRVMELEGAAKAIKYAIEEVNEELLKDAMEADEIEFDTADFHVVFKSMRRKSYDPAEVREIIGDNLFASMGKINNSEIEKLLKGEALNSSQKSRLRSSARQSIGEPKPKITKKVIK